MIQFPDIGPEQRFKAFLAEGKFMIQRSRGSGRHTFYPRLAIPGSGDVDLEWVEASGTGTIYSITVNRRRDGSSNVALIDLDEGVRIISTLPNVETAAIGTRVRARIAKLDSGPAIVFDVANENQA
jgi:uncharacterized OB-fold protein